MRVSVAVVSIAAAAWLRPADVRACSCDVGLNVTLPADGEDGVPTNTRIWVDGTRECVAGSPVSWRVLDPDGVELAYTSTCVRSRNIYDQVLVLHPEVPLRADTAYRVEPGDTSAVWGGFGFTTGAGPDLEPPTVPVETDRVFDHSRRGGSCDDAAGRWATLTVEGEAALFVLETGDEVQLDIAAISGDIAEVSVDNELVLGSNACHGDNFPGGVSRRAETTIRYGAYDLAGNFSGWTEPSELSMREGGCSVGARASAGWWLVVLLGLLRRRSR